MIAVEYLKKVLAEDMSRTDKVRKAEFYLGTIGVTKIQLNLWEAAQFEMDQYAMLGQEWEHTALASRYLDLLRDRVKAYDANCQRRQRSDTQ